jgi:2'-5' RNA ligase
VRLFIAVALPEDVAAAAFGILPEIPALRRVRPDLMHVTLAFLGTVEDGRLDDVIAAAADAAAGRPAFRVSLDSLGRFPPGGEPTVAWLGIGQGANEMTTLAASVHRALTARSLPFDAKPFRPHVTLGRVRENADRGEVRAVAAALARGRVPQLDFTADAMRVVESHLSSKGPRYTARAVLPLDRGGKT